VREERVGAAMADLNGHAAGNGGHSQGTLTAHRVLLYSELDGLPTSQELCDQLRALAARPPSVGLPIVAAYFSSVRSMCLPVSASAVFTMSVELALSM
jgi:hypothetical protein